MGRGTPKQNRDKKRAAMSKRGDKRGGRKSRIRGSQKDRVASGICVKNR